jgi:hypothetical protein
MGFDPWKIPCLTRPLEPHRLPLVDFSPVDLEIADAHAPDAPSTLADLAARVARPFTAAAGWAGHVEAAPRPLAVRAS